SSSVSYTLPPLWSSWRRRLLYLHSFPTRRSSDLDTAYVGDFNRYRYSRAFATTNVLRYIKHRSTDSCHVEFSSRWCIGTSRTYQDRKSTRLNSSHVKISYAVFCLKKKT